MVVICSKSGVTLRAFAVTCLVASLKTIQAEDMKALGQYGILLVGLARWTGQLLLKKEIKISKVNLLYRHIIVYWGQIKDNILLKENLV